MPKEFWYDYYNTSRQGYSRYLKIQAAKLLEESIILECIQEQKRLLPNSGGRKMHYLIAPRLAQMNIKCGRDRLFKILRNHDLLVLPKRNKSKTTNSRHHYYVYKNLIGGLEVTRIIQVWVCDITYIRTLDGFMYLALITDAFSRKIVGFDISSSLELTGCLRALKKALRGINKKLLKKYPLIHHSDKGSQYCSKAYTELLHNKGVMISMAATGNCYENAMAERINGILKGEFELDQNFRSKELALKTTKDAIHKYNYIRPHLALNYATPASIFDPNFKELKAMI